LARIGENLEAQNQTLKSLEQTDKKLRKGAQKRAEEEYQARVAALELEYDKRFSSLDADFQKMVKANELAILQETEKLNDLRAKQLAYIEAKQREEEIKAKEDYYKLVISEQDKLDIDYLRNAQKTMSRKDSIDKVIWDIYYKPAYDALMPHLFKSTAKVSGIYRITDTVTGQSYIGQSVDVRERMRQHIKAAISSSLATNRLYQAMKKDELWNFTFEILEEVPKGKLNERETYYIELYQTKVVGLNKTIGGA
jgi:hypothetical protein